MAAALPCAWYWRVAGEWLLSGARRIDARRRALVETLFGAASVVACVHTRPKSRCVEATAARSDDDTIRAAMRAAFAASATHELRFFEALLPTTGSSRR